MKNLNLLSLIQAKKNLKPELFHSFLKYKDIINDENRGPKQQEFDCIESLITKIWEVENDIHLLDDFFIGYSIPQIGKEFDLLRIGAKSVINIELKSESTIEKILNQQKRNYYYLAFLNKRVEIFTYEISKGKLFKLVKVLDGLELIESSFEELCHCLKADEPIEECIINDLFDPTNYLISPFNSTYKFIKNEYFLTKQQEEILKKISNELYCKDNSFAALTGNAGTGKTLLTYHIAREAMNNKLKVLILHCAQLNKGHDILKSQYGWDIDMPRHIGSLNGYDLIIVDEAQRLWASQFDKLIRFVNTHKAKCIFSYDDKQYLHDGEASNKIGERIVNEILCTPHKLTDKIRTNKEMASFIRKLLDKQFTDNIHSYTNIDINYVVNYHAAKALLNDLYSQGWKTPNYTPGTRTKFCYEDYKSNDSDCAHSIIGQEYDKVALIIDPEFSYTEKGQLIGNNRYYSQRQMLYQIVTRTRKRLHIVILNNPRMLERCLQIVGK